MLNYRKICYKKASNLRCLHRKTSSQKGIGRKLSYLTEKITIFFFSGCDEEKRAGEEKKSIVVFQLIIKIDENPKNFPHDYFLPWYAFEVSFFGSLNDSKEELIRCTGWGTGHGIARYNNIISKLLADEIYTYLLILIHTTDSLHSLTDLVKEAITFLFFVHL